MALAALVLLLAPAFAKSFLPELPGWKLEEVASSAKQWTGVAVTPDGRMFVNFPRWSDGVDISVAELSRDGALTPYPSAEWNRWSAGADPKMHFVCVQSVVADGAGSLWILDPGSPFLRGVVPGAAKLLRVDLKRNEITRVYFFDARIAGDANYLNDVRVDLKRQTAYITDSGVGAIVVLDLETGAARRALADHFSTKWEQTALIVGGRPWLIDGQAPAIHSDGIALSADGRHLYYQALSGRTLYRVPTAALRDASLSAGALAAQVELVGRTGAADGLAFDNAGRLLLSALEFDAIHALTPDGKLVIVAADPRIAWPDSFAVGADGSVYFTTSQIHLHPNPPGPHRVMRLIPPRTRGR